MHLLLGHINLQEGLLLHAVRYSLAARLLYLPATSQVSYSHFGRTLLQHEDRTLHRLSTKGHLPVVQHLELTHLSQGGQHVLLVHHIGAHHAGTSHLPQFQFAWLRRSVKRTHQPIAPAIAINLAAGRVKAYIRESLTRGRDHRSPIDFYNIPFAVQSRSGSRILCRGTR